MKKILSYLLGVFRLPKRFRYVMRINNDLFSFYRFIASGRLYHVRYPVPWATLKSFVQQRERLGASPYTASNLTAILNDLCIAELLTIYVSDDDEDRYYFMLY